MRIGIKSIATATVAAAALTTSALALSYEYAPSPYQPEFLNNHGCTWEYVTSMGGSWGVSHYYTSVGSCQYENQQVAWSSYYPSPGTKYFYDVSGYPFD